MSQKLELYDLNAYNLSAHLQASMLSMRRRLKNKEHDLHTQTVVEHQAVPSFGKSAQHQHSRISMFTFTCTDPRRQPKIYACTTNTGKYIFGG